MGALRRPLGAVLVLSAVAVFAHFAFSTFYADSLAGDGVLRIWYALDIVMAACLLAALCVHLSAARAGGDGAGAAAGRRFDATAMVYATALLALAFAWDWVDFLSKGLDSPQSETRMLVWTFVDSGFVVVAAVTGLRLLRPGSPVWPGPDPRAPLAAIPAAALRTLSAAVLVICAGVALHATFTPLYPDGAQVGRMWDVINFFMAFAIAVTLIVRLGDKLALDRGDGATGFRHITVNLAFYAAAMLALLFLWNWMDNFVNPDQGQVNRHVWSFVNPAFVVLAGAAGIDLWRRGARG